MTGSPLDAAPGVDPRVVVFDAYCRLFEALEPARLDEFRPLCTGDVRFVDPFNDIAGIDRYVALFRHMYGAVTAPRFRIDGRALGPEAGYIRWRFTGAVRSREVVIDGMSEVLFDADTGLVRAHVDHWDAGGQVYARLPLFGAVVRALRRLFAAGV